MLDKKRATKVPRFILKEGAETPYVRRNVSHRQLPEIKKKKTPIIRVMDSFNFERCQLPFQTCADQSIGADGVFHAQEKGV